MPVRTIELPNALDAFIDNMVASGRHATSDDVVVTALERYSADIDAELELVARIDAGDADMAVLEAFMERYRATHSAPLQPITQEFKDRIEKLVGPVEEIDIDLDKSIEGDGQS
jgi:Arc/MetJ-type ribon-helix-helix transcriptional regulator